VGGHTAEAHIHLPALLNEGEQGHRYVALAALNTVWHNVLLVFLSFLNREFMPDFVPSSSLSRNEHRFSFDETNAAVGALLNSVFPRPRNGPRISASSSPFHPLMALTSRPLTDHYRPNTIIPGNNRTFVGHITDGLMIDFVGRQDLTDPAEFPVAFNPYSYRFHDLSSDGFARLLS